MSDESIMSLPNMKGNRHLMVMRLMNTLFIPAYSARQELVSPMLIRMVTYTLINGLSGAGMEQRIIT